MANRLLLLLAASLTITAQTTVTVNPATTYQKMDGFGFSEAFGHAAHLYAYPVAQQKLVLDLLFNTSSGAGFTIIRNRIGSGGSGDSILPTSPGSPSAAPKYVWDGSDGQQVWFSKQAMSYGVKTIYANAWSAPGFMKTNGVETGGGYLCGVNGKTCSSGDWKQAYANFLVQYVKYYAAAGIPITHVGFLNEPEYSPTYSSMNSNGQQAADFVKVLSPTIAAANLSTPLKITCCDSEGWANQVTMTAALKSAGVESMLGTVTSHTYTGSWGSAISTTRPVWQSEYANLSGALLPNNWYSSGGAGEGLTWANTVYSGIVNANLAAYLYWIGAEPGNTNSALILTNGTSTTASKRLWAFAQWSRSVRPGAVRIGASGSSGSLLFSAFKNPDGKVSVQIINNGGASASIKVATTGFTASSASGSVTAQGTDFGTLAVTLSGDAVTATVPARSMSTIILITGSTTTSSTSSTDSVTTTTSSPTSTTTAPPADCTAAKWDQCGGIGYTGCTNCIAGTTCKYSNDWYSQCL